MRLYGRDQESNTLLSAFDAARKGETKLAFVSGEPGTGKTVLVRDLHYPVERQGGYFLSGTFERSQQTAPYTGLAQALDVLIDRLLSEDSQQLARWQFKLLDRLGPNGQVIANIVPKLERLLGRQPEIPQLETLEAKNRFNQVFQQFIQGVCQAEHPLVLFLDDLQWADRDSLEFLQRLANNPDVHHLLLIGVYREKGLHHNQSLQCMLDDSSATNRFLHVQVPPLSEAMVSQLVAETYPADSVSLSKTVYQYSQGIPLKIEILRALYNRDRRLEPADAAAWVNALFSRLPETCRDTLKLAACLGNQFRLETLALACQVSPDGVERLLKPAMAERLIQPVPAVNNNTVYQFWHDAIRQAVYETIPQPQRAETHLKIGDLLQIGEFIEPFAAVNQCNLGRSALTNQVMRDRLAQLNLLACQRAKATAAFGAALDYVRTALELTDNSWERDRNWMVSLHLEASEIEYANGNFARSRHLAQTVLHQEKQIANRARAYALTIQADIATNQMLAAIKTARSALDDLNVPIRDNPPQLDINILKTLPLLSDPKHLAILKLFKMIAICAYVADPELLLKIIFTMADYCLQHGNCSLSSYAYSIYGFLSVSIFNDIRLGYDLGKFALQLVNDLNDAKLKPEIICLFNGHIRHWTQHLRTTLNPLLQGIENSLAVGNTDYAGYCSINYCSQLVFTGKGLLTVSHEHDNHLILLQKLNFEYGWLYTQIGKQFVACLSNEIHGFRDCDVLPALIEKQHGPGLFYWYTTSGILNYLICNDPQAAIADFKAAEPYSQTALGLVTIGQHNFYYSLAMLASISNASMEKQNATIDQVTANQQRMAQWVQHAPMNFQHKFKLVEAELAFLNGDFRQSSMLYTQAIAGACEQQYLQEEALANELAGRFYLARDNHNMGSEHLRTAYDCYSRWGASAKLEQMEAQHVSLVGPTCLDGDEPVDRDFAKVLECRFLESLPADVKKIVATGICYRYEAATQTLVLIPETSWVSIALKPFLPRIQAASPAGMRIRLRPAHSLKSPV